MSDRSIELERELAQLQEEKPLTLSAAKTLIGRVVNTCLALTTELYDAIDGAYNERGAVVAALARMTIAAGGTAGIARTEIEGWDPAWFNCVYIEGPWGQASWHFHDRELPMFADLPPYAGTWDGHTSADKYQRMTFATVDVIRDWMASRGKVIAGGRRATADEEAQLNVTVDRIGDRSELTTEKLNAEVTGEKEPDLTGYQ